MSGEKDGGEKTEGGKEEDKEAAKNDNFVADCEDPELEDLLQSTLSDFESKPVLGADAVGAGDASGGTGIPGASAEVDENFIAEATSHFEQSLRALVEASQLGGIGGDNEQAEAEMAKIFESVFQGTRQPQQGAAPPPSVPSSGDPMEEMMRAMGSMGFEGDSAGGAEAAAGPAAFLPLMSGLLKQVLSKDVLYPSFQGILSRFPAYLEENKGKLKAEDVKRYEEQQRLMKLVCDEFDKSEGDAQFDRIFGLMQEMQSLGHPPKEVIDGEEQDALDLSALGLGKMGQGGPSPPTDCVLS